MGCNLMQPAGFMPEMGATSNAIDGAFSFPDETVLPNPAYRARSRNYPAQGKQEAPHSSAPLVV
jgi:hypothetical protein